MRNDLKPVINIRSEPQLYAKFVIQPLEAFFKRPSKSNHPGLPMELSSTLIFIVFFGGGCW